MCKKIVIVGTGEFGRMTYEFLKHDSDYDVVGFAVENAYYRENSIYSLPIVKFEEVETIFPPDQYQMFVAVTFVGMNKARQRLYQIAKKKGYQLISYVNSTSSVWHDVTIGENVMVMECCSIQYGAKIGNNVIIWPNTSIGHHCVVENNCWIASGCAMGGFSCLKENSFMGMNSCVKAGTQIARFTLIGAGVYINKNTNEYSLYSNAGCKDKLAGQADRERVLDILLNQ